ncbi:MAG TPA: TetR family transcriptional regulator, partial [Actinomycetota bacterium]|nr:TetR family transcriptional regulator [Actinomycetota bacterium]
MGPGTVGLRERKKLRTRAQLTDAALRLFTERGFDGTTIDDIVEAVEVSPRTFFRYFDSKEDVVIGFFDDMGEELRAMLAARPQREPPFTAVRRSLGSLIGLYTD